MGRSFSLSRFPETVSLSREAGQDLVEPTESLLFDSVLHAPDASDPPALAAQLETSATFALSETLMTQSEMATAPPSPVAGALRPGKLGGAARLQENARHMKIELNESREEARRYRQRLVHLEGDAHGKAQWAVQWERQVCAALPPPAPGMDANLDLPGLGPAGVGWSAWKGFIDRAMVESMKTQRLLPRAPQVEWHRATRDQLEEEASAMATELRTAEQALLDAGTENARLMAQIRRCETRERELGRKRTAVDVLQQELASKDRERKSVLDGEDTQRRYYLALHAELGEAQRALDDTPQEQMLMRVERAVEQRDYFDYQMSNLDAEAEEAERLSWEAHDEDVEQLTSDVGTLEAYLRALQEESMVEEEAWQHEEAAMERGREAAEATRQRTRAMAAEAHREAVEKRDREVFHDEFEHDLEQFMAVLRIQALFRGSRARRSLPGRGLRKGAAAASSAAK